jgi:hypothetical protein
VTNEQKALLKTLERVLLKIRMIGYEGQSSGLSTGQSEEIADLADALHNIPEAILESNNKFDLEFNTEIMLGGFDSKYKGATNTNLLEIYEHILNNEI